MMPFLFFFIYLSFHDEQHALVVIEKSAVLSGSCPAIAGIICTSAEALSASSPDGPAWTVHFGSGRPTHVLDSTACTAYVSSKNRQFFFCMTHVTTSLLVMREENIP